MSGGDRRKLRVVASKPEPPVDIYGPHLEAIRARDWDRVAIEGDRRGPVEIGDRPRAFVFSLWPTRKKEAE